MQYQQLQQNIQQFLDLLFKLNNAKDKANLQRVNEYTEQTLVLINELIEVCILQLNTLQKVKRPDEIILLQAHFTEELNQKLSKIMQHFLNVSLNQIAHYNDCLKTAPLKEI